MLEFKLGCYTASPLRAVVASPRGLLRHCFLTAADHVPDLIVDSSLRASRMVFVKLYEFFADFYDRRRRDNYAKLASLWASAWLLYLYASSSMTSSPPPSSLLRLLHLF